MDFLRYRLANRFPRIKATKQDKQASCSTVLSLGLGLSALPPLFVSVGIPLCEYNQGVILPKAKKRPLPGLPLGLHPIALSEMEVSLDATTQADIALIFSKLHMKTHQEIAKLLDARTEPKVFQWERSNRAGTLRVVFAWGKSCLWFIGAFVKANNPEGERHMKRILPRAKEFENRGV
jgi:hypothetical protein